MMSEEKNQNVLMRNCNICGGNQIVTIFTCPNVCHKQCASICEKCLDMHGGDTKLVVAACMYCGDNYSPACSNAGAACVGNPECDEKCQRCAKRFCDVYDNKCLNCITIWVTNEDISIEKILIEGI